MQRFLRKHELKLQIKLQIANSHRPFFCQAMQKLKDIIGRLLRPSADGIRQVFALSRREAERLPLLPSIAIISITEPGFPEANLAGFSYVLRLSFVDVDFLNPNLSQRTSRRIAHAFTERQNDAIRSFVEALPNEIASVVVHCEGGRSRSRSCAVAVALHELYCYHVEARQLVDANPFVVSVMTKKKRDGTIEVPKKPNCRILPIP